MTRLDSEPTQAVRGWNKLALSFALAACSIGAIAAAGWIYEIESLKRVLPGLKIMDANAAFCLLALGVSLIFLHREQASALRLRLGQIIAGTVSVIGLAGVLQRLIAFYVMKTQSMLGWTLYELIEIFPGRMAFVEALNFALLGAALFSIDERRVFKIWPSQLLIMLALLPTILAFNVHFFGIQEFTPNAGTLIVWHLLAGILLIMAGILLARPDRGIATALIAPTPGGIMARRMLPAALLIPALLWLGLYAQHAGILHLGFSLSILVMSLMALFISFMIWTGIALNRSEAEITAGLAALRRSEKHLRELSNSLEEQVIIRTAELRDQTVRLRNLTAELTSAEQRERKRLAALLHDGLQQSLVAAKMALASAADASMSEAAKDELNNAVELLDEAVRDARDLTRELRPPVLYESGLVDALKWLAKETSRRHNVHVSVKASGTLAWLSDDAKALLFESVRELVFNAVKHAEAQEITIEATETRRHLLLAVRDNGRGFESEPAAISSGDGFGLFSIRERIASLRGSMDIISTPNAGTSIELKLPSLAASAAAAMGKDAPVSPAAERTTPEPSQADRRTRVLIADDHPILREGLANILTRDSRLAVVAQAGDGLEAIEAVKRHNPDVVLMDVNMPRMNGIEATRVICRRWEEIAVIGLSVQDDDATARSMIDAGAAAFLSKSGNAAQMISTVVEAASTRQRTSFS
jgi:signal transduction histidine kinase/CheY-like chemotaxis protein